MPLAGQSGIYPFFQDLSVPINITISVIGTHVIIYRGITYRRLRHRCQVALVATEWGAIRALAAVRTAPGQYRPRTPHSQVVTSDRVHYNFISVLAGTQIRFSPHSYLVISFRPNRIHRRGYLLDKSVEITFRRGDLQDQSGRS